MRMICLFSVLCFWGCQSHAGEQELRVPLGEVGIERICVTQSGVIVGAKTSLDIVVEKKSSKAVPRLVLRKYDVMARPRPRRELRSLDSAFGTGQRYLIRADS